VTTAPPTPQYLTTSQAATLLAARGLPVSRQTVRNWMTVGVVRDGRRVYLRHLKVRQLITRKKWLREFIEASQRVPPAMAAPLPRAETPDAQAERFRREKEECLDMLRRRKPHTRATR
jgi:hypothetical protein